MLNLSDAGEDYLDEVDITKPPKLSENIIAKGPLSTGTPDNNTDKNADNNNINNNSVNVRFGLKKFQYNPKVKSTLNTPNSVVSGPSCKMPRAASLTGE